MYNINCLYNGGNPGFRTFSKLLRFSFGYKYETFTIIYPHKAMHESLQKLEFAS